MNNPSHLKDQNDPRKAGARELRGLRRIAWLFPLLGFPLGLLIARGLWGAILLSPSFLPDHWMGWITPKGLLLGSALSVIPILWWMGIQLERRTGTALRRWPVAPLLGALGMLLSGFLFQTNSCQSIFWQAVRIRAGTQFLAREISLLRENASSLRSQASQMEPGLVLLGSSQMIHAIDMPSLAESTSLPVFRRAVAGLFPTELVASQEFSDFHPDNQLVLMLSGFDLGARDDLYTDAIRPLSTHDGLYNVLAAAPYSFWRQQWRSIVDLSLAAECDLWRSRDYARFLLQHPFEVANMATETREQASDLSQKRAYEELGNNRQMVDLCKASLHRFFKEMSGRCRQITVFEGRVNPAYPSGNLDAMTLEMHEFLLQEEELGHIRYIQLAEQEMVLPDTAWRDMTHVSPIGRTIYTEMFARVLGEKSPPQSGDSLPSTPSQK